MADLTARMSATEEAELAATNADRAEETLDGLWAVQRALEDALRQACLSLGRSEDKLLAMYDAGRGHCPARSAQRGAVTRAEYRVYQARTALGRLTMGQCVTWHTETLSGTDPVEAHRMARGF